MILSSFNSRGPSGRYGSSKAVLLIWFISVCLFLVSVSLLFSPFVCLDDIKLGLGS